MTQKWFVRDRAVVSIGLVISTTKIRPLECVPGCTGSELSINCGGDRHRCKLALSSLCSLSSQTCDRRSTLSLPSLWTPPVCFNASVSPDSQLYLWNSGVCHNLHGLPLSLFVFCPGIVTGEHRYSAFKSIACYVLFLLLCQEAE